MSEEAESDVSPTSSLNRPKALIPPGSPVRFEELCNGKQRTNSQPNFGDLMECLSPSLTNSKLAEMLVKVAVNDKDYIGGEMLIPSAEGAKQTPTPVEALSPFWTKVFPYYEDVCKDGPGPAGGKKAASPADSGVAITKKDPMTVTLADGNRIFVINNERVVEDGASLGSLQKSPDDGKFMRYFHEGMVMELIPGQSPSMKLIVDPYEDIDGGSALRERTKGDHKAWVESGFCAYLILQYEDPENPKLKAMNSAELEEKLTELQRAGKSPSDERFTPLVNIAREGADDSSSHYTTALYFTTKEYTYFVHIDNSAENHLVLKKYKPGDTGPDANPRNNLQFICKPCQDPCDCDCSGGGEGGKDEVDGERVVEKVRAKSFETNSPVTDFSEGSSNPRSSSASSQLSSPDSSSISNSESKTLTVHDATKNESEITDSGVEAN